MNRNIDYESTIQFAELGYNESNTTNSTCSWTSNDHELDLSAFQGQEIATVDPQNNSISYGISPCDNLLSCDNLKVMSYILDIQDTKCVKYLSIWQNGVISPNYNPEMKTWQFVYNNGQLCDGFENIFEVFWVCDKSEKNNAKIVDFDKTDVCSYKMIINSSFACS